MSNCSVDVVGLRFGWKEEEIWILNRLTALQHRDEVRYSATLHRHNEEYSYVHRLGLCAVDAPPRFVHGSSKCVPYSISLVARHIGLFVFDHIEQEVPARVSYHTSTLLSQLHNTRDGVTRQHGSGI